MTTMMFGLWLLALPIKPGSNHKLPHSLRLAACRPTIPRLAQPIGQLRLWCFESSALAPLPCCQSGCSPAFGKVWTTCSSLPSVKKIEPFARPFLCPTPAATGPGSPSARPKAVENRFASAFDSPRTPYRLKSAHSRCCCIPCLRML